MKLLDTLVALLMLSLPGICEDTKPARLGVTRGYGLGSLWAEIQIDRTVYVSHDYCEAAGLIGSYPAEVRKNTVRLHVGNKVCKYHILYDRPALKRGVRNKEASDPWGVRPSPTQATGVAVQIPVRAELHLSNGVNFLFGESNSRVQRRIHSRMTFTICVKRTDEGQVEGWWKPLYHMPYFSEGIERTITQGAHEYLNTVAFVNFLMSFHS